MSTVNRIVSSDAERHAAAKFVAGRPYPFTLSLTDGKHRTSQQNRLQQKWMLEISQQLGDRTPEEARGYCKLHFGVPILRAENEAFRSSYDKIIRPLPYPAKIEAMMEPLDLPVTRLMNTKQKTEYMDKIHRHFSELGVILTNPEDLKFNHTGNSSSQAGKDGGEISSQASLPSTNSKGA